jgi:outer membrane protein assembly factor BamB
MVRGFQFSVDRSSIFGWSEKGTLYLFDKLGNPIWKYKTNDTIYGARLSPNNEFICAVSYEGNVYLLNMLGKLLSRVNLHSPIRSISISQNNDIAVCTDEEFLLLDSKGNKIWGRKVEGSPLALHFSSDNSEILLVTTDAVYNFDRSGKTRWQHNESDISAVCPSKDFSLVLVASNDCSNTIQTQFGERYSSKLSMLNNLGNINWNIKVNDSISKIGIPENKFLIIICTWTGKIYAFDTSGNQLWKSGQLGEMVRNVSIAPDSSLIAPVTDRLFLFNYLGNQIWTEKIGSGVVTDVVISNDKLLLAASSENSVFLFVINSILGVK